MHRVETEGEGSDDSGESGECAIIFVSKGVSDFSFCSVLEEVCAGGRDASALRQIL